MTKVDEFDILDFEGKDWSFRFTEANQVVGMVRVAERRRWWAPWSKRKVIIFEGDIEQSAKLLFQTWGQLGRGCCTDPEALPS